MAIAPKVLGSGQLPTSKGTLYTVPGSTSAYVKFLRVHNTNAATQTVIIYANTAGTSRIIGRAVLAQNETAEVIDSGAALTLETGDLIEGVTTTSSAVDYVITGAEET